MENLAYNWIFFNKLTIDDDDERKQNIKLSLSTVIRLANETE